MNRMIRKILSLLCLAGIAAGLSACSGPDAERESAAVGVETRPAFDENDVVRLWSPEEAYSDLLMDKAHALAKRELGRMAAAELVYRNRTEMHELVGPIFAPGTGSFMKMYRSFEDYEVEDIYRSESYLYPVAYQIRFRFTLLATPGVRTESPADQEKWKLADGYNEFRPVGEYSVVRRYRADRAGDYVGNLPDLPPRPNFFRRNEASQGNEPGAALPNPVPPGGMLPPGMTPIPPGGSMLPPISGPTF